MSEEQFIWTPKRTKKLFELKFRHDWLFKAKKQPWNEFRNILLQNGFPEEMTINHVRKKWSYTYDSYKIAKKTKNRRWKYYKMFEKHYGKITVLDKHETWDDDWRLKLITCITESRSLKLDLHSMWRHVEKSLRSLKLPSDCCIQDIKSLWQHLRTTFNRKHRLKCKKGEELTEWPLYDAMLYYYETYDLELLTKLEIEGPVCVRIRQSSNRYCQKRNIDDESKDDEYEFQWTKDITESFIQIRLQNDWLFRERKWAWNDLQAIMVEEYAFPKALNNRELCRKWTSLYSEYQKALATNNTSWLYYNLFECYLGESSFSFNPITGWKEEWVLSLIQARTDLECVFSGTASSQVQQKNGWREVEKRLRSEGLPIDHSLLDLPDIWTHLLKTYRWKRKFAKKGMLTEHWPYYDAMTKNAEILKTFDQKVHIKKLRPTKEDSNFDDAMTLDDDFDDDIKLFDLKQKMKLKPKDEKFSISCRACNIDEGTYNIFEACDDQGLDLAHKLNAVAGLEIDKTDHLPKQICFNCLKELEIAYSFRMKCRDADKEHRAHTSTIPIKQEAKYDEDNPTTYDADHDPSFDNDASDGEVYKHEVSRIKKETRRTHFRKKKKIKKDPKSYSKMCEICGKRTSNLRGHLDAHAAGKAYSCDVCDKRFKFKSGLQIHRAVHDPTPKKTCEICGKTFHILAQYRRHFAYHANERKHACDTCGKRFNTIDILKVHMRMHTDERPFPCPECGKTFRTSGCVSRHKRIVHKKIAKMITAACQ